MVCAINAVLCFWDIQKIPFVSASNMMDRHTIGQRGKDLRYSHKQFYSVLHHSVIKVREILQRDENLNPGSERARKLRENTVMLGRRYSEGLHQAIEAKERVDVQKENKTLATKIGRAVQQECRDRSRMPSSA